MSNPTRILIVFAKTPARGTVKTRIGVTSGMEQAAAIYEHLLGITLEESAANHTWQQIIAITPESDGTYFSSRGLVFIRQAGDHLGDRLRSALQWGFEQGADHVIIIGSDCPTLSRNDLGAAFSALTDVPAIIGPSLDGGFYLFGVTRNHFQKALQVFQQAITWSSPQVFDQVQSHCQRCSLPLVSLPPKSDIDTYEDWLHYRKENPVPC